VVELLQKATQFRRMWEDMFKAMPTLRSGRKALLARARTAEYCLRRARPLISLLKHDPDYFGDLGAELERRLKNYVNQFRFEAVPFSGTRARHRPGERWSYSTICDVFKLFNARCSTRREALRLTLDAFELEGHADVITPHIVDNVTRAIQRQRKRRNRKAGPTPTTPADRSPK
jgi:hypothetical protein